MHSHAGALERVKIDKLRNCELRDLGIKSDNILQFLNS